MRCPYFRGRIICIYKVGTQSNVLINQGVLISELSFKRGTTVISAFKINTIIIAGNFWGRKLPRIGEKYDFRRENSQIVCFCCAMLPNFAEKTCANSYKTAKFTKVFSLESFPLYGTNLADIILAAGFLGVWSTLQLCICYSCSSGEDNRWR